MSAIFPSATPATQHGDEGQSDYSMEEEAFIEYRTDLLLAERLNDWSMFRNLVAGLPVDEIEPHLHRALMNLDRAMRGEAVGQRAVFISLSIIQCRLKIAAQTVWTEECRAEAEKQLKREFA